MMDKLVIEEMSIRASRKDGRSVSCCHAESDQRGEEHAATVVSKKPGTRTRGLYRLDSRGARDPSRSETAIGRRVLPLLLGLPLQLRAALSGSLIWRK